LLFNLNMPIIDWLKKNVLGIGPLSEEAQNHPFVKSVLEITEIISNYQKEKDVIEFLQDRINHELEGIKSDAIKEQLKFQLKEGISTGITAGLVYNWGALRGILGAIIVDRENKVEMIKGIIDSLAWMLWELFDKKTPHKQIVPFITAWLNLKVLKITEENDISSAWNKILKDKILKTVEISALASEVGRRLRVKKEG